MTEDDLIDAAEAAGLEYYGEYNGRCHHEGFAVQLSDATELLALGAALSDYGLGSLIKRAHVDSLGRGMIVSFPRKMFQDAA